MTDLREKVLNAVCDCGHRADVHDDAGCARNHAMSEPSQNCRCRKNPLQAVIDLIETEQINVLRTLEGKIRRDHSIPANVHQRSRSWPYRGGFYDGANRAADAIGETRRALGRGMGLQARMKSGAR